jgi:hypothetical protein
MTAKKSVPESKITVDSIKNKILKDESVKAKIGTTVNGFYNDEPYKLTVAAFGKGTREENAAMLAAIEEAFEDF